jgi:hypothetical protein
MSMDIHHGMIFTGKPEENGGKPASVPLHTSNSTRTDPDTKPGLRGEKLATNSFGHGMA